MLLLFRLGVTGSNKGQENAFLWYMDVTHLMYMTKKTRERADLIYSTGDELLNSLRHAAGCLEERGLCGEE